MTKRRSRFKTIRFLCFLLTPFTLFLLIHEGSWQEGKWQQLGVDQSQTESTWRQSLDLEWTKHVTSIPTKELKYKRQLLNTSQSRYFEVHHTVAVKLFKAKRKIIEDVEHEIQLSTCLHHENLVQFHGLILDDKEEVAGTVMEYFEGEQLEDLLDELNIHPRSPIPWTLRVDLAFQLASALEYLHSHGIVHFDVKPEQILVQFQHLRRHLLTSTSNQDPFDRSSLKIKAKLIDYGLALHRSRDSIWIDGQLENGTRWRGTRHYLAPELFINDRNVTNKVDVYSFGVVLWEMYTRQYPYRGHKMTAVGQLIRKRKPVGLKIPVDCEVEWRDLVMDCMSWRPEDRPSFQEIKSRLESFNSTPKTSLSEPKTAGLYDPRPESNKPIIQTTQWRLQREKKWISFIGVCPVKIQIPDVYQERRKVDFKRLFRVDNETLSWEDKSFIAEGIYGRVYSINLTLLAKIFKDPIDESKAMELYFHSILRHTNLIQFFALTKDQFGRINGVLLENKVETMQLLNDYLRDRGPLPKSTILELVTQLLDLVLYLGRNRISLVNLSPDKVLIEERFNLERNQTSIDLKVFDLSEATCKRSPKTHRCHIRSHFLAPEVCERGLIVPFKTDLYSVAQFIRVLCGKSKTARMQFNEVHCGKDLLDFISKCQVETPRDRPSLISVFNLLKEWRTQSNNSF